MISKERFILFTKISMIIILSITSLAIIPKVLSKYESSSTTNPNLDIAFYIINATYQTQTITLDELSPRVEPYLINFTVSNNDGTNRLETDAMYELSIVTTTNLPLIYRLYKNEFYTDSNATNIIASDLVNPDQDGTYFKTLTSSSEQFSYSQNEMNSYQLVIYFPTTYMSYEYQDIVESIEIIIDSKQIIADNEFV